MNKPNEQKSFSNAAMNQGVTHKVSAIYSSREEAEAVSWRLIHSGIAVSAIDILHQQPLPLVEEDSDKALNDILVDGAIGTVLGTGVGALGTAVLWISSITLFVASPVVAPLAMLGWFASVGGVVGAATGAIANVTLRKEGKFSELVMDAIKAGNTVLVVYTHNESERELAKQIITDSLKGRDKAVLGSD